MRYSRIYETVSDNPGMANCKNVQRLLKGHPDE